MILVAAEEVVEVDVEGKEEKCEVKSACVMLGGRLRMMRREEEIGGGAWTCGPPALGAAPAV